MDSGCYTSLGSRALWHQMLAVMHFTYCSLDPHPPSNPHPSETLGTSTSHPYHRLCHPLIPPPPPLVTLPPSTTHPPPPPAHPPSNLAAQRITTWAWTTNAQVYEPTSFEMQYDAVRPVKFRLQAVRSQPTTITVLSGTCIWVESIVPRACKMGKMQTLGKIQCIKAVRAMSCHGVCRLPNHLQASTAHGWVQPACPHPLLSSVPLPPSLVSLPCPALPSRHAAPLQTASHCIHPPPTPSPAPPPHTPLPTHLPAFPPITPPPSPQIISSSRTQGCCPRPPPHPHTPHMAP